jgi:hypothetical protein
MCRDNFFSFHHPGKHSITPKNQDIGRIFNYQVIKLSQLKGNIIKKKPSIRPSDTLPHTGTFRFPQRGKGKIHLSPESGSLHLRSK